MCIYRGCSLPGNGGNGSAIGKAWSGGNIKRIRKARKSIEHDHVRLRTAHNRDIESRLTWALLITIGIFALEIVGGFFSNSLALKSDAGHLFGDIMALGLSLFAARISRLPPTSKRTYGYHRSEVLAAIINGVTLFFLSGFIFYEAYRRLLNPEPVRSTLMLVVAVVGLAANLVVLARLHKAAGENLNVRSAFLHVMGDMLGSVGVVVGGLIMLTTGNYLADPIISFFVGAIIFLGAIDVLREGANILLEGVPRSINYDELKESMEDIEGVISVHDLHVWTISSANLALSAHVTVTNQSMHESQRIINDINELLRKRYHIHHATLQLECDCCIGLDCGCIMP
jgi:cobalt-zinc-cadmium efflux system protein